MISRYTLWLLLVLCCLATNALSAQVLPDSVSVDSLSIDTLATDSLVNADSLASFLLPKKREPEKIFPWKQFTPSSFETVSDDSLLRWQIWPNWGDYYAFRSDVISSRQGTLGRIDAFQISGFNPYEQRLNLEGIDLSNPITGLINYNYVPHHKIGEVLENKMTGYHSEIRLKKYYLVEPISYMNYDEAKFNYRNLEFSVAQNFTERTNLEISFWDRRDGDSYPRNDVLGNQIVARGYHYLTPDLQLRTLFLRNQFELQEPFGYQVDDPLTFQFDRFASVANVSNAESDNTRRDWVTGLYKRADSSSVETAGIELTLFKEDFNLPSSLDSLRWDMRGYSVNAFNVFQLGDLDVKINAAGSHFRNKEGESITKSNWSLGKASSLLTYKLFRNLVVAANGRMEYRSDSFSGYEFGVKTAFSPSRRLALDLEGGVYSRIPTIQHLYWSGDNYSGNSALENETGVSMLGRLTYAWNSRLTLGFSARYNEAKDRPLLNTSRTFASNDVSVISGTLFGKYSSHRYEFESSITFDALGDTVTAIDRNEQKIWLRNNAFVKGYMFDRATYVKAGIRTLVSPLEYGSSYFNTELQYWQANSTEAEIPPFFRMDAELSARIRAIMVVIRWENVLDGMGQLGYFETATFPMPARRFLVGIRAQFRN